MVALINVKRINDNIGFINLRPQPDITKICLKNKTKKTIGKTTTTTKIHKHTCHNSLRPLDQDTLKYSDLDDNYVKDALNNVSITNYDQ